MSIVIYRYPKRLVLVTLLAFCATTVMMLLFYTKDADIFSSPSGSRKPVAELLPNLKSIDLHTAASGLLSGAGNQDGSATPKYEYSRNKPIVFIGGMPRSGTTLLRVMLDSHPDIRCGGETRVIPRILNLRNSWLKAPMESKRLVEAGITSDVLDHAVGEFMLEIIARHGRPARRLCNKDPFTLKWAVYIRSLFPRAQFLFMIRDGRAVAHSIVSRKVTISGFNISDYRQCMKKWNSATSSMYEQCQQLGPQVCLPVHYEQLVLHPEKTMRAILQFLELPWNGTVLHHEKFINRPDGIELSKLERSSDQVVKPVNTEKLTQWVGKLPADVVRDMADIAPMLSVFGYNPHANPPNYGDPDSLVISNMRLIEQNRDLWREKEEKFINERERLRKELLNPKQQSNPSSTTSG